MRCLIRVMLLSLMLAGSLAWADVPHRVLTGGDSNLVYIITPSHTNPIFKQAALAAAKAAKYYGYRPRLVTHEGSAVKQAVLFETAISEKAAAIICDNAGFDATVPAVKRAYDNNIPTFLIDRGISEPGFAVSQLISDTLSSARDVGELLAASLGYEGEYCELYGQPADLNSRDRSQGFHEALDKYPKLKCVEVVNANWDERQAYESMIDVILRYPNLKGIVCGNDAMALGALAAIRQYGHEGIKIVSIDGTLKVRKAVEAGEVLATVVQPVTELAKAAVLQLKRYLHYGTTTLHEIQYFDCLIVTRDNVKQINRLLEDGQHF
ncbi:MAG: substrate-binding domain-containing protein [Succinivibrio sp.]|nr:substrate-binding domain-containing protein [Succinivibrio sp.]